MEQTAAPAAARYSRWLPYWAVLRTDLRQSTRSWVYRVWVFACVLAAVAYVSYRFGVYREAGILQSASAMFSDLLRWVVYASVALIGLLTVGSIASERGSLADSVLSRGVSRTQYFLAKWHARTLAVLGTFWVLGAAVLLVSNFLLHEDVQAGGGVMALTVVSALLAAVVSLGVTVSALCNSTLAGALVLWVAVYGAGLLMSLLPKSLPVPDRVLSVLPNVVRGEYDPAALGQFIAAALVLTCASAVVGMVLFSRRDV